MLKNELVVGNRSQAEEVISSLIRLKLPKIKLIKNDRSILTKWEIDILLPEIKMALEIQGPFHYFPIYGEERLEKTKISDAKKADKLKELGYTIYYIDLTKADKKNMYKYLKEEVNNNLIPIIKSYQIAMAEKQEEVPQS